MIKLKPGEFYVVTGKEFDVPKIPVTYEPAMFVREESLDIGNWYVFAALWYDHQLARVRVLTKDATRKDNIISAKEGIVTKLILFTRKEREGTPFQHINDFLDKAHELIKNNRDFSVRNLKEEIEYNFIR
jgi:hypothetical protein